MEEAKEPNKIATAAQIILLCTAASVLYAVLNDEITVQICPEYFTVGHARIFGDQPLAVLGLLWGICAGTFPGLALGVLLAIVSTRGTQPIARPGRLIKPVVYVVISMGIAAGAAGFTGWCLAQHGLIKLPSVYASRVPSERHAAFFADWYAHGAAYLVGYAGGVIIIARMWKARRKTMDAT